MCWASRILEYNFNQDVAVGCEAEDPLPRDFPHTLNNMHQHIWPNSTFKRLTIRVKLSANLAGLSPAMTSLYTPSVL